MTAAVAQVGRHLYTPQRQNRSRVKDWLLAGYVLLLPIQFDVARGFHLAPSDVLLAVMLFSFALGTVRLRFFRSAWSVWHLGLLLSFLAASLVTLLQTGHLSRYVLANKDIGLLILFAAYAVVVSEADTWPRIRRLLRILILSTAIQNAVFLALFLAGRTTGFSAPGLEVGDARLHGLLIDPNAYGGLLVLVLSVHLRTYCEKESLVPGFLGKFTTVNLAIGIVLTYSRSAWIGLAVLFLMVTLLRPRMGIHLLAASCLAFVVIWRLFGPTYFSEMQSLAFRESAGERLLLIDQAIPMFWESPAFGIGLGVFENRVGTIIHNTPVWFLTEFGLFGFTWFAGFVVWFLHKGVRGYRMAGRTEKPLILGLVTADVAMMGLSMGIEALYQRHWWLILALIVSSYSAARRERWALSRQRPPHGE